MTVTLARHTTCMSRTVYRHQDCYTRKAHNLHVTHCLSSLGPLHSQDTQPAHHTLSSLRTCTLVSSLRTCTSVTRSIFAAYVYICIFTAYVYICYVVYLHCPPPRAPRVRLLRRLSSLRTCTAYACYTVYLHCAVCMCTSVTPSFFTAHAYVCYAVYLRCVHVRLLHRLSSLRKCLLHRLYSLRRVRLLRVTLNINQSIKCTHTAAHATDNKQITGKSKQGKADVTHQKDRQQHEA